MRNLLNEVEVFLLEAAQFVRGAWREGNDYARAAVVLLITGPVLSVILKCTLGVFFPRVASALALITAFLPVVGAGIWLFWVGPLWIAVPEILSAGGRVTAQATMVTRQARNHLVSLAGICMLIGIAFAAIPSHRSVFWTFVGIGVVAGSAMWNASPHKVRVSRWAQAIAIAIVVALYVTGDDSPVQTWARSKTTEKQEVAAAAVSKLPPLRDRNFHHDLPPGTSAPPLYPGNNHLAMMPGADTGCIVAPAGWRLREGHDQRYDDKPCTPGQVRWGRKITCEERPAIRVWVGCHVNGVGTRSYRHSDYRPMSVRVLNDTGEGVESVVFLEQLPPPMGRSGT